MGERAILVFTTVIQVVLIVGLCLPLVPLYVLFRILHAIGDKT